MSKIDNLSIEELEKLLEQKHQQVKQQKISWQHIGDKNKPKPTKENLEILCRHLGIRIAYNEMTKNGEIHFPNKTFHEDTKENASLAHLMSECVKWDFPTRMLTELVILIANENAYHPVRDWIDSQTWDGVSRLEAYYDTVISDNPMKETLMRKWALSAVAALYHRDFSCEGVLCFQGEQGAGKTTSVLSWLPEDQGTEWLKDGVILDPKVKDNIMKIMSYWIVELGELDATFRKSDIEALKAFITEGKDVLRKPFERKTDRFQRRTVFYASVNEPKFLQDDQNRRFWAIGVRGFRPGNFDVGQFWAEMKEQYMNIRDLIKTPNDRIRNNEWGWFLSPEERRQLERATRNHKVDDPIDQTLENKIVLGSVRGEWRNVTDILTRCGKLNPNKADLNRAGKWLRDNGFEANSDKRYKVEISDEATDVILSRKRAQLSVISPEKD
jgi:putative DNA primase/helicase